MFLRLVADEKPRASVSQGFQQKAAVLFCCAPIPFKEEAGKIYYTVPKIECHQMVVIDVAGNL